MNKIWELLKAFNTIIKNRETTEEALPGTTLYNLLNFFLVGGNAGINALREILEEAIDDTVDVFFEECDDTFETHISICYEYHDFEIIKYTNVKDTSKYRYIIYDTSRKAIDEIKSKFFNEFENKSKTT